MISYQLTADLLVSADITYNNMRAYYQHYGVNWQQSQIKEKIVDLENWDILYNASVVGAIRLAFEDNACYIRDLQVNETFQNNGIGAAAIAECERLAINAGVNTLKLRVFKISPAYNLYKRNGFETDSYSKTINDKEDDNFFYMSKEIS